MPAANWRVRQPGETIDQWKKRYRAREKALGFKEKHRNLQSGEQRVEEKKERLHPRGRPNVSQRASQGGRVRHKAGRKAPDKVRTAGGDMTVSIGTHSRGAKRTRSSGNRAMAAANAAVSSQLRGDLAALRSGDYDRRKSVDAWNKVTSGAEALRGSGSVASNARGDNRKSNARGRSAPRKARAAQGHATFTPRPVAKKAKKKWWQSRGSDNFEREFLRDRDPGWSTKTNSQKRAAIQKQRAADKKRRRPKSWRSTDEYANRR